MWVTQEWGGELPVPCYHKVTVKTRGVTCKLGVNAAN